MAPLIKLHKNTVYDWITERGLDPTTFSWRDDPDGGSRLTNRPTGHWFEMSLQPDGTTVATHVPSLGGALEGWREDSNYTDAKGLFQIWCDWVALENEPDLWADTPFGADAFRRAEGPEDNAPLTADEVRAVEARIANAKNLLEQADLDDDQLVDGRSKLDYLVDAARRVGRYDWFNIAFTVVWSIAVAGAFDPERARELLDTVIGTTRLLIGG